MKRNLVAILAVVLVPAAAAAQPGPGPHGGRGFGKRGLMGMHAGPGMHMMGLHRCLLRSPEIGLTEDQRRQIDAIRDEVMADVKEQAPKMRAAHEDFIKAFADKRVSAADLKARADAMHAEVKALMDRKWETVMKVRDILTPEQLAKVPDVCRPGKGRGWDPEGPDD